MSAVALDTDQAKTIALIVIVGLLVVGVLISLLIQAIVKRLVVMVVVLVLAGVVYGQRASIQSAARKCDATFFGHNLTLSNPSLRRQCEKVTNR